MALGKLVLSPHPELGGVPGTWNSAPSWMAWAPSWMVLPSSWKASGLPGHVTPLQPAGLTRLLLCTVPLAALACSVGAGISSFQDWFCLVASRSLGACTESVLNLANGVASVLLCFGRLLPSGMRDLRRQALFLSACRSLACRGCSVTVCGKTE